MALDDVVPATDESAERFKEGCYRYRKLCVLEDEDCQFTSTVVEPFGGLTDASSRTKTRTSRTSSALCRSVPRPSLFGFSIRILCISFRYVGGGVRLMPKYAVGRVLFAIWGALGRGVSCGAHWGGACCVERLCTSDRKALHRANPTPGWRLDGGCCPACESIEGIETTKNVSRINSNRFW